ncbi:MAG: CDP-glucose 4,6-dehydratase [Hyphomicrobiales bacterium]|uniref:CDP-glucose 4,6-dehydratase n=1 Tax=Roseibium polysiphoniae TaxID=2571221 RepID=UPI0032995685
MNLPFESALNGRRVLVTGHTGFKGGWLSIWLNSIGASVSGISLKPSTYPNMFTAAQVEAVTDHHILDISRQQDLSELIARIDPQVVFHMAAQPLVRRSYAEPIETFRTNALGTAHVLDACRKAGAVEAIVSVTTDKVYRNYERETPYSETNELGGRDPYSASKVAAEYISASYRESFFSGADGIALATARGGNVIGGGDWSEDRLVPDIARAIASNEKLEIRNPASVRPWQHVLALCHGYLQLADALLNRDTEYQSAWNFGPSLNDTISVQGVLDKFAEAWELPEITTPAYQESSKYESRLLMLDCNKAREKLGWKPAWDLNTAILRTATWYNCHMACSEDTPMITLDQISEYRSALAAQFH